MSVIQNIRDKYARVAVIAIALSLLGFIAMDAFSGRNNLFGSGQSTTVGVINGKSVDIDEFRKTVAEEEEQLKNNQYMSNQDIGQQAIEAAWNREVYKNLVTGEAEKMGLRVTQKELNDILFVNPPADLKQQFTDPQTGQYNAQVLLTQIKEIRKSGTPERKAAINSFLDRVILGRLEEKYNSFFNASVNYPKWMIEKQNAESNQQATVSYVVKPYTDIVDSTIKVTDEEVKDYINKYKDNYKQEENRAISYVTFSALPSAADSAAVRSQLMAIKPRLDSATDMVKFLPTQGVNNYYNSYVSGKIIQISHKDSIFKIPVGSTYGPYLDGGSYSIAKLIGVRQIPDSAKIRHILVATVQQDPQTGQMVTVRDTTQAKALIDSIRGLANAGQNFDSLVNKFSDDGGSKAKGGVYETASGQMVPEFNDFIFTNPAGSKGVVLTQFGYHYIEILSQRGSTTGYKIAYISQPINTSSETDKKARNDASSFAADSRDEKSFNDVYEKKWKNLGYNKGIAVNILPSAYQINGLGSSRELVKKIYEADKGEVLQPEQVGDNYVVAVVTAVNEEGTMDVSAARMTIEPVLRNEKKAALIKKQINGTVTSLESIATTWGKQVITLDSVRFVGDQRALGFEPKVIGAAFNPANRGKVVPELIAGAQGVYAVKVDNVVATPSLQASVAEQRKMLAMQAKYSQSQPLDAIRRTASIKDKRSKFY